MTVSIENLHVCIHTCIIVSLYHTQAIDFDHLARMAMIKRRVRLERRNIWRKFLGGTADLGRKIRCTDIWGKMEQIFWEKFLVREVQAAQPSQSEMKGLLKVDFNFFSAINVNFFQHGHNSDAFGWTTAEAFYDLRRPTFCPKNNEYKR